MSIKKTALRVMGIGLMGALPIVTYAQNAGGFFGQNTTANPNLPGSETLQWEGLLRVIQNAVNWILALLGFIALLVLLWGGFQMVTAAGEDSKYQNGFKILKQAGIGLILIGVSWFVISIIFYIIGLATQ